MAQMQIILSRSILRLLRRSNIATTSPASMPHLVSTSRPLLSFMPSGTAPSALARGVSPSFAAANQPSSCVSKFSLGSRNMASSSGVKGEELGNKRPLNPSAKDEHSAISARGMKHVENIDTSNRFITRYKYGPPANVVEDERRQRIDIISGKEDTCRTTMEVMDSIPDTTGGNVHIAGCELSSDDKESWVAKIPGDPMDVVPPMYILPESSHRDGSVYRETGMPGWKTEFCIADRNETRLEAMMFSDPTGCQINDEGDCMTHSSWHMLQIFSLKLANIPLEHGPVELYGYIAARDSVDRSLNYVINFSRDDPITVEQGSLIDMTGPKRGIRLIDTILIEYDMKIKMGGHEKEDLQLIDGVSFLDDIDTWNRSLFTCRIHGDCGAVDITATRLAFAVEATVEVIISQVQSGFSMRLGCFTSRLLEEILLFNGAIAESRVLKRSVVAVAMGDKMDLKFTVAADSCITAEHCCSFKATQHGHSTQEIKSEFSLISVKVTWSTLADWLTVY